MKNKNPRKISVVRKTPRAKTASAPTQWELCKRLAVHFKVSAHSCKGWFASGCPRDFDAAVEWKTRRDADRSIRGVSGSQNRLIKVIEGKAKAADADDLMPLSELSETFAEAVSLVVELRQAGLTTTRLAEITGFSRPVIKRICFEHPALQAKAQATTGWTLARALAVDRLIDALDSEESAKKLSGPQLATIAGIASDKLRDLEPPTSPESIAIKIKAQIDCMSFEELINSIPKTPAIEGEFTPAAAPLPLPAPTSIPSPEDEQEDESGDD